MKLKQLESQKYFLAEETVARKILLYFFLRTVTFR